MEHADLIAQMMVEDGGGYSRIGLIGEYLFKDGLALNTGSQGAAGDGIVVNATPTTDSLGNPNSAFLFDKPPEMWIDNSGLDLTGLTESTIVIGMRYDGSLSSTSNNFLFTSQYSGTDDLRLGINANSNRIVVSYDDGDSSKGYDSTGDITIDNSYHTLAFTQETGSYKTYYDKILLGEDTSGAFDYAGLSGLTRIGNRGVTVTEGLIGMEDIVLVYDLVLIQEEIDKAEKG